MSRERLDLSSLRQDQGYQIFRGQTEEGLAVHRYGESQAPSPLQDVGSSELKLPATLPRGVGNYQKYSE